MDDSVKGKKVSSDVDMEEEQFADCRSVDELLIEVVWVRIGEKGRLGKKWMGRAEKWSEVMRVEGPQMDDLEEEC